MIIFIFVTIIILELFCRVLIDPVFFYKLDTYNEKSTGSGISFNKYSHMLSQRNTKHLDYLFIGSSRVPATINPKIFKEKDTNKVVVVAGRGYTTAGTTYQALKNKVSKYPDYLKNAKVFIEYTGSKQWDKAFNKEQFRVYEPIVPGDKAMPHVLLPFLDTRSFIEFIRKTPNSNSVKANMSLLFFSSLYRSESYMKEKLQRLNKPIGTKSNEVVVAEGGIRNDKIKASREKAVSVAKIQMEESKNSPVISLESLNKSILSSISNLIKENGGTLYLYKMPLHSISKSVYISDKEMLNNEIFEEWLKINEIPVIYNSNFKYCDSDFPDISHLSKNRRDEFSMMFYDEYESKLKLKKTDFK
jgi:hypothetical protein